MKESKFIELLNLYVDHQISADDAALLETEVRANPERRRVYRQYCMMQKASTELGNAFRTEAPAPATTPEIIEFKPRRRNLGLATYAATFGAMAACIIVAVAMRPGAKPATPAAVPASLAVTTPAVAPALPAARALASRPALLPAVGPRSLQLREPSAELVNAPVALNASFGDWMSDLRLASMDDPSIDELRFDGRAPLPAESRDPRAIRPFQGKVEMAAVRFQK